MTSSFKKTTQSRGRVSFPSGTRPSFSNNQLLVSTGIPSLDNILGGGLAVGTILLIEEDGTSSYSELILKYFLAEGVMSKHGLFLASRDKTSKYLMKTLPGKPKDESTNESIDKVKKEKDDLQIAWRYKNLGHDKNTTQTQLGHTFDLSCTMSDEDIEHCQVYHHAEESNDTSVKIPRHFNLSYGDMLNRLTDVLKEHNYSTDIVRENQSILRAALFSFGSPSWQDHDKDNVARSCLPWFLLSLKANIRSFYAVAVVSIPTQLFEDTEVCTSIENSCDAVIKVESFAGSDKEKNPAFKEYHGLIHVKKLPCVNSIAPIDIDTNDLAFKLKRKKFCIEKLHLPPELSETANRTQSDPVKLAKESGIPLCGIQSKALDF